MKPQLSQFSDLASQEREFHRTLCLFVRCFGADLILGEKRSKEFGSLHQLMGRQKFFTKSASSHAVNRPAKIYNQEYLFVDSNISIQLISVTFPKCFSLQFLELNHNE